MWPRLTGSFGPPAGDAGRQYSVTSGLEFEEGALHALQLHLGMGPIDQEFVVALPLHVHLGRQGYALHRSDVGIERARAPGITPQVVALPLGHADVTDEVPQPPGGVGRLRHRDARVHGIRVRGDAGRLHAGDPLGLLHGGLGSLTRGERRNGRGTEKETAVHPHGSTLPMGSAITGDGWSRKIGIRGSVARPRDAKT